VTGLAVIGERVYLGSRTQNRTFVYQLPDMLTSTGSTPFGGGSLTSDIERTPDGRTWVASERADLPLCLLSVEGRVEAVVDTALVPAAAGVALDDEGFLWVSVPGEGILRLDVSSPLE
jgi:hypothetical protein